MALATSGIKRAKGANVLTMVGTITASGNYATNGDALDLSKLPGVTNRLPDFVDVNGIGGYIYQYDVANKKLKVFVSAGFTPAGSVDHTHDMKFIGGIATTEAVMIAGGDTLGKNAATDRTIAGANSATKGGVVATSGLAITGTAVAAAALAELAAGAYPAGVTGDTIKFIATWLAVPSLN